MGGVKKSTPFCPKLSVSTSQGIGKDVARSPTYPVMGNPYISPITRGYLWVRIAKNPLNFPVFQIPGQSTSMWSFHGNRGGEGPRCGISRWFTEEQMEHFFCEGAGYITLYNMSMSVICLCLNVILGLESTTWGDDPIFLRLALIFVKMDWNQLEH